MKHFLKHTFFFILLVFIQVFIIDELHLHFMVVPMLYVALVLILPFNTPKIVILLYGFFVGLTIDAFENSIGIHAAAMTAAAMVRIITQAILSPREGFQPGMQPSLNTMGAIWYLRFILPIILIHDLVYYLIDLFNSTSLLYLLSKTLSSSLFSFVIIFFSSWAFEKKRSKNSL